MRGVESSLLLLSGFNVGKNNHKTMKKSLIGKWLGAAALAVVGMVNVQAAGPVKVDVYRSFGTYDGTPFSDLAGSFTNPDADFVNPTSYAWHPFGLQSFGAVLTGCIEVGSTDVHLFQLDSDDGSSLFIDNVQIIDNGGGHGPNTVPGAAFLTAGIHSFEVRFFEDFSGPSGVNLILDQDTRFVDCQPVPEVGTLAAAGVLAGLVATGFRRRAAKA